MTDRRLKRVLGLSGDKNWPIPLSRLNLVAYHQSMKTLTSCGMPTAEFVIGLASSIGHTKLVLDLAKQGDLVNLIALDTTW